MQGLFRKFANKVADLAGTPWAFLIAVSVILTWAITGPMFKFSDTWQLIINTGTTIVTFLMVFLIQSTQNRDNAALHAKLDELIVHTKGAHNELAAAEDFTEEQLKELKKHFEHVSENGGTSARDELGVSGLDHNKGAVKARAATSASRRGANAPKATTKA